VSVKDKLLQMKKKAEQQKKASKLDTAKGQTKRKVYEKSANKNIQSGDRQGSLSVLCFYGGKGEITIWQMQELKNRK